MRWFSFLSLVAVSSANDLLHGVLVMKLKPSRGNHSNISDLRALVELEHGRFFEALTGHLGMNVSDLQVISVGRKDGNWDFSLERNHSKREHKRNESDHDANYEQDGEWDRRRDKLDGQREHRDNESEWRERGHEDGKWDRKEGGQNYSQWRWDHKKDRKWSTTLVKVQFTARGRLVQEDPCNFDKDAELHRIRGDKDSEWKRKDERDRQGDREDQHAKENNRREGWNWQQDREGHDADENRREQRNRQDGEEGQRDSEGHDAEENHMEGWNHHDDEDDQQDRDGQEADENRRGQWKRHDDEDGQRDHEGQDAEENRREGWNRRDDRDHEWGRTDSARADGNAEEHRSGRWNRRDGEDGDRRRNDQELQVVLQQALSLSDVAFIIETARINWLELQQDHDPKDRPHSLRRNCAELRKAGQGHARLNDEQGDDSDQKSVAPHTTLVLGLLVGVLVCTASCLCWRLRVAKRAVSARCVAKKESVPGHSEANSKQDNITVVIDCPITEV